MSEATAQSNEHSPPKFPAYLPGEFWGITTFINPFRYKNKLKNYRRFRQGTKQQGLRLLCVELVKGKSDFQLNLDDADKLIQLRAEDVLWQKERLLNIALKNLPPDCDKIAWLDADIIFSNNLWVSEAANLLQVYNIAQLFSYVVRLSKNQNAEKVDISRLPLGDSEGHKIYGVAYSVANFGRNQLQGSFIQQGHTGYAWAARRSIFERHGFYDRSIMGGADFLMASAFFDSTERFFNGFSYGKPLVRDQQRWAKGVNEDVQRSVYYVPGVIFHLWHGKFIHRQYDIRARILSKFNYSPDSDIELAANGCWKWKANKPLMHFAVKYYFLLRNEEGNFLISLVSCVFRGLFFCLSWGRKIFKRIKSSLSVFSSSA